MNIWKQVKQQLAAELNQQLEKDIIKPGDFILTPDASLGDLALPLFVLAKDLQTSPAKLAIDLAANWNSDWCQAEAAGAYLNFRLSTEWNKEVLANIETGENERIGEGQEVMIEYSNANTHKEYHLGHLRNISYGDAMGRLYRAAGFKVWPVSYINDFGIHVAKTIWALKRGFVPMTEDASADKGFLLGQAYVEAVKQLEILPEGPAEVSQIMQNIEARTGEDYDLWTTTRQWSLDYFASIYQELKIEFAEHYYESEYIEAGRALVDELLKKGILRESQGAIIADLEEYGLGVLVVLRADGTALYPVADLALAQEKFRRHELTKSLYVVDVRQSLYFKQLFKVLELMGYRAEMAHLPYDFVKLPSGMMSSRTGNTISYRDLYLKVFEKFKNEIADRHVDWDEDQMIETARILTVATLKFEMLKVGADKVICFDVDEALRFDGFTASYLEYVAARINSVLSKSGLETSAILSAGGDLSQALESRLVAKLAQFEEKIEQSAQAANPSELAKYLYELAQLFNDYYQTVPLLVDDSGLRAVRMRLLLNIRTILQNGLELLGIEIVRQM
ncbi:MAG: arginine--tRNA ligase [Candidatus Falkowbacteria bacterium]